MYRRGTYICQSINYTEEVRQCIQKMYLYIPISQLHRRGKKKYTEEVLIYTNQSITRGGKIMYTEEIPLYTNLSITQRR